MTNASAKIGSLKITILILAKFMEDEKVNMKN